VQEAILGESFDADNIDPVASLFQSAAEAKINDSSCVAALLDFQRRWGLRSLSVADVNGDGTLDIVTADELFDEVSVLQMRDRRHVQQLLWFL